MRPLLELSEEPRWVDWISSNDLRSRLLAEAYQSIDEDKPGMFSADVPQAAVWLTQLFYQKAGMYRATPRPPNSSVPSFALVGFGLGLKELGMLLLDICCCFDCSSFVGWSPSESFVTRIIVVAFFFE